MSTSSSLDTATSLLHQAGAHDEEAWRRLAQLYSPMVYRWARVSGLREGDAADIVQEVFVAVALNLHKFRRDRPGDSFRGWLRTICKNKVHDHFRRLRGLLDAAGGTTANMKLHELVDVGWDESDATADSENHRLQHRAVEQMKEQFDDHVWDAFFRTAILEHKPAQVANDLGISVWAVYKAKSRVLQRLQRELAEI